MSRSPKKALKKLVAVANPDGTFRRYATYEDGLWDAETVSWVGAPAVVDEELTHEQYVNLLRETTASSETATKKAHEETIALLNAAGEELRAVKAERDELKTENSSLARRAETAEAINKTFHAAFARFGKDIGLLA